MAAFATRSDLLILDEPTSELDPLMDEAFNVCIADHTAQGATVLLSSHILSEVERLADRVTIIRAGRAVETGTLAQMRHLRRTNVRAELTGEVPDRFLTAYPWSDSCCNGSWRKLTKRRADGIVDSSPR